ncbi:MAG: DNA-binding response regulator [Flavobacteriales bacterium]|nr:DNA-binding response regulator [Flavobacteriales bacterium]
MEKVYSILIVEDEPLISEDIAGYLVENGFRVAGIAETAGEAKALLGVEEIDAVLLDINLGEGEDGISVGTFIRDSIDLPFVYLTSFADKNTLERAKHTRPNGYLIKPFDGKDIMTSLEVAIFNHSKENNKQTTPLSLSEMNALLPHPLSEREFELIRKLREGRTNKEIACELCISVNTVKTHLQHLFVKLDAKNRTEAIFKIFELSQK